MAEDDKPETPNLLEGDKPGKWITVAGRRVFIPEGKKLEDVFSPDDSRANKASYMTASQETAVKVPYNEYTTPHYITTAHELETTQPRPGEFVKYNHGEKEGILISIDRSVAKILNKERTGYEWAQVSDVAKAEDYTVYGLWGDIPEEFRASMLRKARVDPNQFVNKRWNQLPKALKEILRDEKIFTVKDTGRDGNNNFAETRRTEPHADSYEVTSYDGAKDTIHKHADAKNPEHAGLEGLSGNLRNPQEDKRREGRQFPDNDEQNNTFSAGEENIKEPYSVNITGGSSAREDYGTQLTDWRYGMPKPFKDQEQTLKKPLSKAVVLDQIAKGLIDVKKPMGEYESFDSCVRANSDKGDAHAYCGEIYWKTEGKEKADLGADSYSGENRPLSENPQEIKEKAYQVGVPQTNPIPSGVKYLTKDQAKKFWEKKQAE